MSSLAEAGVEVEINFRVKRYYSIYQKLRRQEIDISELYDIPGVPHRDDRICATPTPRSASSTRTGVRFRAGSRTTSRCRSRTSTSRSTRRCWGRRGSRSRSRSGRARWTSSPKRASPPTGATRRASSSSEGVDKSVLWLRQLLEFQTDVSDPRHFLSGLKLDLYQDEVYVFSPKGDVLAFPRDAMPLDFAYRIHTDLGHRCTGARVNGRLVPLRTPLKTGDIVEILTSPNRVPSRDWLSLVVTSRAKHKIRHWLNTQQTRRRSSSAGACSSASCARYRLSRQEGDRERRVPQVDGGGGPIARPRISTGALGYGKVDGRAGDGRRCCRRRSSRSRRSRRGRSARRSIACSPAAATGRSRCAATATCSRFRAKCCRPVPGDEIVGYITRGRGVSVHSVDCPNVKNLLYNAGARDRGRLGEPGQGALSGLAAHRDRGQAGMLARLTEAIARRGQHPADRGRHGAPGSRLDRGRDRGLQSRPLRAHPAGGAQSAGRAGSHAPDGGLRRSRRRRLLKQNGLPAPREGEGARRRSPASDHGDWRSGSAAAQRWRRGGRGRRLLAAT